MIIRSSKCSSRHPGLIFYINLDSGDLGLINETSEENCLFSFSSFSDRRSLKLENENNRMKTYMQQFDHRSLIYGTIGTPKRVLFIHFIYLQYFKRAKKQF